MSSTSSISSMSSSSSNSSSLSISSMSSTSSSSSNSSSPSISSMSSTSSSLLIMPIIRLRTPQKIPMLAPPFLFRTKCYFNLFSFFPPLARLVF
ncbi:MAG: hypothetical protein E7620_06410 [Ruminococcaceae bacterium]|nr:hypothetical protein [Oscillospiraceae bacterium]